MRRALSLARYPTVDFHVVVADFHSVGHRQIHIRKHFGRIPEHMHTVLTFDTVAEARAMALRLLLAADQLENDPSLS